MQNYTDKQYQSVLETLAHEIEWDESKNSRRDLRIAAQIVLEHKILKQGLKDLVGDVVQVLVHSSPSAAPE